MSKQILTFQEALEIVELLPEFQQENLLDIIRRRLIARKQQLLTKRIKEGRQEYARGEVRKGSVAELMKELSE
ncbi:hypothetical protein PN36_30175 [Candidatus Thiomargarita nelsonii]|uniref:Uncharacterized protein n=1 Tax=Candidatus Thiomargarita nelsonii TaxID=1003181 RepID=A0A0A6P2K5_9GAMM|nr:hypothetical protein PN36_30175 [Candidatus Thiomargarita nelsonii]